MPKVKEYIGAEFARTIELYDDSSGEEVLYADSAITDVRVFFIIGTTTVAQFAKIAEAGYTTISPLATDAQYQCIAPGSDTNDWRAGQQVEVEVWYKITNEGSPFVLASRDVTCDELIDMNSKADKL